MEAIKYFTNSTFDRESFADLLNAIDVPAVAVENGIILDREALNRINGAYLPHWVFINRGHIRSELHTRPATATEEALLEGL